MIKLEMSNPKGFKEILDVIATITEEPTLEFMPDGLNVIAMDSEHVALINLSLPVGYFDTYNVVDSDKFTVNLPSVLKGLGKLNKDDYMLRLVYDYDTKIKEIAVKNAMGQDTQQTVINETKINEKLTLTLISDIHRVKTFPCLELLEEEIPQPKIFFKSKTRMILKTLKRILEDYKGNLPHVTFSSDSDSLKIWGESDEYSESVTLDKHNDNILEHRIDEASRATYTMDYLVKFLAKAVKVSEVVDVHFSDEMPVKLDVEIPQGKLEYFVAPYIGV